MCSRFELNAPSPLLAGRFGLGAPPPLPNRPDIRPTDLGLAIGPQGARLLRWGLAVDWDARPLINARIETLAAKPTFRRLLGARILVPATAWWEWRSAGPGKIKTRMEPVEPGPFALAGLVEADAFVIVTRPATAALAAVHDRMPLVLTGEAEAAWADPTRPFAEVEALLAADPGRFSVRDDQPPPAQPDLFG